ncbi:flagellin [Luminiphilus sp.]|nr:flagellin [Luminiphilus sp.]
MPLSINTNLASLTAQRTMIESNQKLETAFERLSTGKRINSAVDDAAGLSIGTALQSQVNGMNQAIRNTNDGISMVQIAEGALDEVTSILQRMRDIAVQAANDSLGTTERGYLQTEHDKLANSLDDVLGAAKFNGDALINTSGPSGTDTTKTIQIGANSTDTLDIVINGLSKDILAVDTTDIDLASTSATSATAEVVQFGMALGAATDADRLTITIDSQAYVVDIGDDASLDDVVDAINGTDILGDIVTASAANAGIKLARDTDGSQADNSISISLSSTNHTVDDLFVQTQGAGGTTSGATAALVKIDAALATVAEDRAGLGAAQSQLESTVRNLANVAENTSAAVGRIMDTDYAAETANLTKAQILQQAATSILAQANAQPQTVLALLQ